MAEMIYHLVPVAQWRAVESVYYPETYAQDGFTHCTRGRERLMEVANHFYRDSAGDWFCLEMSHESLEAAGVTLRYEPAAPVGEQKGELAGSETALFPHVYGGLPVAAVLAVYPVIRAADGTFLEVQA
ncbi:MAG: DUF952 domain-containing protein [Pseudomonadota bacterium]